MQPTPTKAQAYQRYLAAAGQLLGPMQPGQYGVFGGKLVKMLDPEEFGEKLEAFRSLERIFLGLISGGSTIDDGVYHELRELARELLLTEREDGFSWS